MDFLDLFELSWIRVRQVDPELVLTPAVVTLQVLLAGAVYLWCNARNSWIVPPGAFPRCVILLDELKEAGVVHLLLEPRGNQCATIQVVLVGRVLGLPGIQVELVSQAGHRKAFGAVVARDLQEVVCNLLR